MKNVLIFVGNLGKDPEYKTLTSGASVASCSLATQESWKDKNGDWVNKTEWHNLTAWRNNAEKLKQLSKGDMVTIFGKLGYDEYEKDDGNKVRLAKITVLDVFKSEIIKTVESNRMVIDKTPKKVSDFTENDDDLPF